MFKFPAPYKSQNLRLFFSFRESKQPSASVDVWYLKEERGLGLGMGGGQPSMEAPPSNTSQRGFQEAQPINACIVFPPCSHRQLTFCLVTHRSVLLACKIWGFNTHSVWKNSKIRNDVVWNVDMFGPIWTPQLREMKWHIYQVSSLGSRIDLFEPHWPEVTESLQSLICLCFLLSSPAVEVPLPFGTQY